ncbi:MAG: outer membrane lipoprotein-sorting protein [Limisphaerales bacterium]
MAFQTKPMRGFAMLLAAVLAAACLSRADAGADAGAGAETPVDARALVSALVESQRTSGSRTRARISVEREGDRDRDGDRERDRSLQVLIKTRREGATNETLVVAMWPKEEKGRAWMIRQAEAAGLGGFRFEPPNEVVPLTSADLDQPLFGSDLSVEDFVESFWDWPDPRVTGSEKVEGADCWVLELRAPDPSPSVRHPRVRLWIAKEKSVAMRIDKLDAAGAVQKRLTAGRVVRRDEGGWVVAEWTMETVASKSRTRVSATRSDRGLSLRADEFSPEGVRALVESSR